MSIYDHFYLYNFNSILISKIIIKSLRLLPKIKKLFFYFIINKKKYKKNLLLFYIIISVIFGGILVLKKKEIYNLQIFSFWINKKKIFIFMFMFINLYLPLNTNETKIKKTFCFVLKKKKEFICRLTYFSFPTINELDVICYNYELIYNYINYYKFQLDFFFNIRYYIKNISDCVLRLYKFPCKIKMN